MTLRTCSTSARVLLACLPLFAQAQAPAPARDPLAPGAPVPALNYRSAFADYRPWKDLARTDWRAANDRVRGPADAEAPSAAPAPAAAMPMPAHGAPHAPGRMK